ncbi:MAG: DUF4390 domain-containing protein [Gammaproteobacteria bacterium]|nr:MAG: DUF4390 domain-containing protein [Gammaproteobacteria bacterium]
MDFIMSASIISRKFILFTLMLLVSTSSLAGNFKVQSAEISKIGNGYILDATISYPLTPRVKEAISNGVPITFLQQLELVHSIAIFGKYWQWDKTLWTTSLRYELRYHALTEQYVLKALDTEHYRNFPSLDSALTALGTIKEVSLPPEHLANTDGLIFQIRSGLDLYALPTPMRPGALLSNKWQVTSPWKTATWP